MHSVREFIELAFAEVGVVIEWTGNGVDEKGSDVRTGQILIEVDPKYFRPAEVEQLLGDPSKARQVLGWTHTVTFPQLVKEMVEADLKTIAFERDRRARHD